MRCSLVRGLAALVPVLTTAACLSGPGFFKQQGTLTNAGGPATAAPVLSDTNGVLTAKMDPSSGTTQTVQASASSAIAGTQIAFPPGSIALATNISVQEGASIASTSFTQQIGLDPSVTVQPAAATVVIQSSTPMDAPTPFTISIVATGASLGLSDVSYAVLYNVFFAADSSYHAGVIPQQDLTTVNGKVAFQTQHFGAYQLVTSSSPIIQKKEVPTDRPIVTANQANAAPLGLDNFTPIVAGSGATVTLTGQHFRPTMTVALGGRPVSKVNVASDAVASFVVPADVPFGFTDLAVEQDGTSETHKFFAMADKTNLPLITVDPAGVCTGVNYYDANGNKQTGTMTCNTAPAATTGDMVKATYDKDGDGKVDQANRADSATTAASAVSAGSAAAAAYAIGKTGSTITVSGAAAQLAIPGDGSAYEVDGSGQVTSISSAPIGTRITLIFGAGATVTFIHNELSTPMLLMKNGTNVGFIAGDVTEFVSQGNGSWSQVSQAFRPPLVVAGFNAGQTATLPISTSCPQPTYGSDTPLSYAASTDFGGSFASGDVFTAPTTGTYVLKGGLYVEFADNNSNSGYTCYIDVYTYSGAPPAGSTVTYNYFSGYSSYSPNANGTYGCFANLNYSFYLPAQSHVEFHARASTCSSTAVSSTATIKQGPPPSTGTATSTSTGTGTGTGVSMGTTTTIIEKQD